MTDIVERLRAKKSSWIEAILVMEEAADEIERLLADVTWWEHQYGRSQTEIERLRKTDYYDYRLLNTSTQQKENSMSDFKLYRRKQIAEIRPFEPGENLIDVSISAVDKMAGSPKDGDMVARNPANHADQWLLAKKYFEDNFEPA